MPAVASRYSEKYSAEAAAAATAAADEAVAAVPVADNYMTNLRKYTSQMQ